MFGKIFNKPATQVKEKCERELEVKYTSMLTREFCVSWLKMHLLQEMQKGTLLLESPAKINEEPTDGVYKLRLDVVENDIVTKNPRSFCCCLIFALDIEPSLKHDLVSGAVVFTEDKI